MKLRLLVSLSLFLVMAGCSSIPSFLLPSNKGISATAVGTQMAQEATQQVVVEQRNADAGRDVIITEKELEAIADTVNINQQIPMWVIIALVIGWLAPSPSEMGRGLSNLLFRRRQT